MFITAFTMKARFDLFTAGNHPKQFAFDLGNNIPILSSLSVAQLTSSPLRSNSLTKRKLAIMILNLVHKIIMTKKMVSHIGFLDASYDISYNNHKTSKELKEKEKGLNKNNSLISKLLSKENHKLFKTWKRSIVSYQNKDYL